VQSQSVYLVPGKGLQHWQQELSYCWDGHTVLHNSNFCFRVGVPLFDAVSQ